MKGELVFSPAKLLTYLEAARVQYSPRYLLQTHEDGHSGPNWGSDCDSDRIDPQGKKRACKRWENVPCEGGRCEVARRIRSVLACTSRIRCIDEEEVGMVICDVEQRC